MLTEHDIPEPQPLAYDVRGAARAASVSDRTLRDAIAHGRLRARKLGRKILILRDDLQGWLAALPHDPAGNGVPVDRPTTAGARHIP